MRVDRVDGKEERRRVLGGFVNPGKRLVRQEIGGIYSWVGLGLLHVMLDRGVRVLVGAWRVSYSNPVSRSKGYTTHTWLDHKVVPIKAHIILSFLVVAHIVEVHQLAREVGLVTSILEPHRQPSLVESFLDEFGESTWDFISNRALFAGS